MGEQTEIAWTDHSFNPWWGCEAVSPGCAHCYARAFAKRVGEDCFGQSPRRLFGDKHWREPYAWDRKAARDGVRRRVFCASMADVFEDRADLIEPRLALVALILGTPHLDWLLLTKRIENVERLAPAAWARDGWPANIWLGVTAEDQEHYDTRWPALAAIPAAVRFVSHEPGLGPLTLHPSPTGTLPSWCITGGESGPKARPFNPSWAKSIVNQCRDAGVACFVKQLGANCIDFAGVIKDRAGADPSEWPTELRVRERPRGVGEARGGVERGTRR